MNKLVKRLLTGTLAFATILTALPVTAVHASGNQYWTESAERAWFTLPCNIEALKQTIGLPPDSDHYLISDYDFPFEILQDTDLDLLNNICLAISESEIPPEDIPAIQREWFSNLQELEAGLCNITYHRNCSDMEETSEHFLCVHGRFYEYNE